MHTGRMPCILYRDKQSPNMHDVSSCFAYICTYYKDIHLLFPVLYPLLRMHKVQRCQITACYFLLLFLTSSLAYIYLFS